MSQKNLKPLLKWAGGKTQLLAEIAHAYPKGFGNTIRRYAEPFVGGGAVLFDILSKFELGIHLSTEFPKTLAWTTHWLTKQNGTAS